MQTELRFLIPAILLVASTFSFSQDKHAACSAPEFSQFDFWLGEWELTWPAEQMGGKAGETGHGTNNITKRLRTEPTQRNGKTVLSRMVFKNITDDSLDWDWQRSTDGGDNWIDVWNIHYRRKNSVDH